MTNEKRALAKPGDIETYPVLPLRDIVVFPHMIVPLFVGRDKSIRALEEVMKGDRYILLATQKIAADDDPATDAIFTTGSLATSSIFIPSTSTPGTGTSAATTAAAPTRK